MTLPRVIKALGVGGFLTYICVNMWITHEYISLIQEYITTQRLNIAQLYVFLTGPMLTSLLFAWFIYSAIVHGLLRTFRIGSEFKTTFLLCGHSFYKWTIAHLWAYRIALDHIDELMRGILPPEIYAPGIVFGVIAASLYTGYLLAREYEVQSVKTIVATLVANVVAFTLSIIILHSQVSTMRI